MSRQSPSDVVFHARCNPAMQNSQHNTYREPMSQYYSSVLQSYTLYLKKHRYVLQSITPWEHEVPLHATKYRSVVQSMIPHVLQSTTLYYTVSRPTTKYDYALQKALGRTTKYCKALL